MIRKISICVAAALLGAGFLHAQKPALDHSVYDGWKSVSGASVPGNGEWMYYTVSPQQGDAVLYIEKVGGGESYECPRGYDPKISEDGSMAVYKIRPTYSETRTARIKKKKPDQMPHDSLAVLDLRTGSADKIASLKSLVLPFTLKDHIVYSKYLGKKDSLLKKDDYIVLNIRSFKRDTLHFASNFKFNPSGTLLAYDVKPGPKDSLVQAGVYLWSETGVDTLFKTDRKAVLGNMFWNERGDRFAFYANADTSKAAKKMTDVYVWDGGAVRKVLDYGAEGIPQGWKLSDKPSIGWRFGDSVLTLGTCPIPPEKDTTLVSFEQPMLDIWAWNDEYIQPLQKLNAGKERDRSYLALLDLGSGKLTQIASEDIPDAGIGPGFEMDKIIVWTAKPYHMRQQWDQNPCADYYLMNLKDGKCEKTVAQAAPYTRVSVSPDGRKAIGYDAVERAWFSYDIESGQQTNLTEGLGVDFYDVNWDTPSMPAPAGGSVWFEDSKTVAIRDRFDYWVFDLTGSKAPYLLTEGKGRADSTVYNINLPYDRREYFSRGTRIDPSKPIYFITQNLDSKQWGVAVKDLSRRKPALRTLVQGPYKYDRLAISTASKTPVIYYSRESFEDGRDLYASFDLFKTETRLTEVNPQMKEYNWGTVELMKWTRDDGVKAEAMLFKPEDFDASRKYPIIFYFYDKSAQTLYEAKVPAPSRSVVNIPYFVSNGYVVCVPDMYYKMDGHPGRDAVKSVLSAADEVCRNSWADEKHMGIQGQSWGGYQVAYIITQTGRFAAAGAGAPVSNMTSAYGGIRWGSGWARTFQYEQQQSRIGKDLWSGRDLYYDNSPLFFLPNVTTPVLIMHNDNDGAVPWWQGIEMYNGLRRLGKPCWLLQYNHEAHNLNGRWNSKDLSIRLQQFFDHYLKEEPMPEWMSKGVPATMKGYTLGYEKP